MVIAVASCSQSYPTPPAASDTSEGCTGTDDCSGSGSGADVNDLVHSQCDDLSCLPLGLGACEDDECVDATHACASTRGQERPATCAPLAESPAGLHETCTTFDASGTQNCHPSLTCVSPTGADQGVCLEWCAASSESAQGTCPSNSDVCVAFDVVDFTVIGGLCSTRCNPSKSDACDAMAPSICADVSADPFLYLGPTTDPSRPEFVCIVSKPGEAIERDDCMTVWQHYPATPHPPADRCSDGLTCARYKFADQAIDRPQCLRVCDAPEDCLPTETCVSSLEFTEAVGEPVGVCETV